MMWQLSNHTRFAADRTFLRDRDGREVLVIVIKATFSIGMNGELAVAEEQAPIVRAPVHTGLPGGSSLLYDTDFVLTKSRTDILLNGHAYTQNAEPATFALARVRVGGWEKRIVVTGDRLWKEGALGASLGSPEPFVKMPLVYERAFGGPESEDNPVGVATPNLEDPNELISARRQRPRPMSFGPIAAAWQARRRFAGTYDEKWMRERRPLVPGDFDDAFWQAAPPDQQVTLEGGEPVELAGVSPRGTIRFDLPRLSFVCRNRIDGKVKKRLPKLHTVLFEPDEARLVLVYQSTLRCHHTLYTLRESIVDETQMESAA